MGADVHFERATEAHARALVPLLRPEHLAEYAAGGRDPGEGILEALRVSEVAFAASVDGELAALFGVVPDGPALCGGGVVWLLTTTAFVRHRLALARVARGVVASLARRFGYLIGAVDVRFRAALRWAEWLGFRIGEPVASGLGSFVVHPIAIRSPA